jgi:hypothetical protein
VGLFEFPFVPKTTARLVPGHFWSIPLSDGRFGCGRVLALVPSGESGSRTVFVAGLLRWVDTQPPTLDSIAGAEVMQVGHAHVGTIGDGGGSIVGYRALDRDGLAAPESVRSWWGDGAARAELEHIFVHGDPPPSYETREVASPLTDDMMRPFTAPCGRVQFQSLMTDADFAKLADWMSTQPNIGLRAYGAYDGSIVDLEFLRFFPEISDFSADALWLSLRTLDGLRHLRDDLTDLTIGATKTRLDLHALSRFRTLRSLYLEGQTKNIDVLATVTTIEELTLRSITLPNLDLLAPLSALRSLDIKLGGTRNLAGLAALEQLCHLELWMIKGLHDVRGIAALASLRYLFMESLRQVTELPNLQRCVDLVRIHLQNMKGISDLSPLATAPNLRDIVLVDMGHLELSSLRSIKNHPTLRGVSAGLGSIRKNKQADQLLNLPLDNPSKVPWRNV